MQTIVADLRGWLHQPFSAGMDWVQLFLAIGLVLVFIGFWTIILAHLRRELE